MGIYPIGYTITILALSQLGMHAKVENKIPKPLMRIFILLTFIAPPVVLPFTKGPRLTIPTTITLTVGTILLGINFIIKILAQRQIGVSPALKSKTKLVTTGIYGWVRHPLYLSNGLLALGMAILFKSLYALLFSIPYSLSYLLIIHFEDKAILEEYGEDFKNYKKKVPWRIIPGII